MDIFGREYRKTGDECEQPTCEIDREEAGRRTDAFVCALDLES